MRDNDSTNEQSTSWGATPDPGPLLTPRQVADRFNVDTKTVARWAQTGKLDVVRTLGGHRRYFAAEVDELLRTDHSDVA